MKRTFWNFCKKEIVLLLAALAAALSVFAVPPDAGYIEYMDIRVLCQLFCLMAVVAGLQTCGLLQAVAHRMLTACHDTRVLMLCLIMLPFFASMLVTNDVALLAFVPFAFMSLRAAGAEELLIKTAVLQTVAANLGGMLTPFGNPQNLFIYSYFSLDLSGFMSVMLPLTVVSLVFILILCRFTPTRHIEVHEDIPPMPQSRELVIYAALFIISVLSVLRMIPYLYAFTIVLISLLIFERQILLKVDYALLLTFVCFFILSGNLSRIEAIYSICEQLMQEYSLICSCIVSQFISNVPAAVLLSGMTNDWSGLLAGVNIGGLGTPIASLASLITLKLYMKQSDHRAGRFLLYFTAVNLAGLAVLLVFSAFMH